MGAIGGVAYTVNENNKAELAKLEQEALDLEAAQQAQYSELTLVAQTNIEELETLLYELDTEDETVIKLTKKLATANTKLGELLNTDTKEGLALRITNLETFVNEVEAIKVAYNEYTFETSLATIEADLVKIEGYLVDITEMTDELGKAVEVIEASIKEVRDNLEKLTAETTEDVTVEELLTEAKELKAEGKALKQQATEIKETADELEVKAQEEAEAKASASTSNSSSSSSGITSSNTSSSTTSNNTSSLSNSGSTSSANTTAHTCTWVENVVVVKESYSYEEDVVEWVTGQYYPATGVWIANSEGEQVIYDYGSWCMQNGYSSQRVSEKRQITTGTAIINVPAETKTVYTCSSCGVTK